MIDHTALACDKTEEEIKCLCEEAVSNGFYSVCINACHIPFAKTILDGSDVKICTVVGFPLGATLSAVKAFETAQAIKAGAQEIDMVINVATSIALLSYALTLRPGALKWASVSILSTLLLYVFYYVKKLVLLKRFDPIRTSLNTI